MSLENKMSKRESRWREDVGRFLRMLVQFDPRWLIAMIGVSGGLLLLLFGGCNTNRNSLIVYASPDQAYAEPILHEFTRQTGIKVKAVYDSEAVKTVGLANRLLAERARPQCDVFWNNEELRTRQLTAQNTFRETNAWAAV